MQNDLLVRLRDHIVVVMAYGGWPDIFTGALSGIVGNDNLFPEILWALHGDEPQPRSGPRSYPWEAQKGPIEIGAEHVHAEHCAGAHDTSVPPSKTGEGNGKPHEGGAPCPS